MRMVPLGSTGVHVSDVGLGGLTFGRETPLCDAARIISAYLDAGGNLIDTADIYASGRSEEIIGETLRRRRDDVILMSKTRFRTGPHPNDSGLSRRRLGLALERSLRRLKTDRLDVWLIHGWDADTRLQETLEALDWAVRSGKVLYVGASIVTGWQLASMQVLAMERGLTQISVLSPEYSLVERGAERELLPLCDATGVAVLPWSPLAGGLLAGRYRHVSEVPTSKRAAARWTPRAARIVDVVRKVAARLDWTPAQVSLAWIRENRTVAAPIIGVRTLDQLSAHVEPHQPLPAAELAELDAVSAIRLGYPHDVDPEERDAGTHRDTPWGE